MIQPEQIQRLDAMASDMPPTPPQAWTTRLWVSIKSSLTMVWAAVLAVLGIGMELASQLSDVLGAPDIKAQLLGLLDPKWTPRYILAIAVLTAIARMRSLMPPKGGS